MRTEINKEIEAVSKAADPLKILASADTMKVLGVQRPLLQVRKNKLFTYMEGTNFNEHLFKVGPSNITKYGHKNYCRT